MNDTKPAVYEIKTFVKPIPNAAIESMWRGIRDWHIQQRTFELQSIFELGDHLLNASIITGLKREQVIGRLRVELKELAYSPSAYRRATHLAMTFNANQRKVLISKGVSLIRACVLASRQFDNKRDQVVAHIKSGSLKKWSSIKGEHEIKNLAKTKTLRHGIQYVDDVVGIQVRDHGEFQRSLMLPGVTSWLSQVNQDAVLEVLNLAGAYLRKRGKDVKEFRI